MQLPQWQWQKSGQKSETSKRLFNNITNAGTELTSYYDIQKQHYGLISLPLKDIMEHGTLKYVHQYMVNNNSNSSVSI